MFKRFSLKKLPNTSFFLFGPRQVGKSTLIKATNPTFTLNLLKPEHQLKYTQNPSHLRREIEHLPADSRIFIDEIQRVPKLLDVIHDIMESGLPLHFVLCGSSARKLRHGAANLLGGRAVYRTLHPLSILEIGEPIGPIEKGMTYIVRPFMQPSVRPVNVSLNSFGSIQ